MSGVEGGTAVGGGEECLKNTEWHIRFAILMHHSGITLEIKDRDVAFQQSAADGCLMDD